MGARPQARELPVKRIREIKKTFLRPKVSLRFPANGMTAVVASKYIDTVHPAQITFVPRSFMKLGNATATTVVSMEDIRRPNAAVTKVR